MEIKIPNYPAHDKHLWADYFELISLIAIDRYLTKSDMEDRIHEDVEDAVITLDEDSDLLDLYESENEKQKIHRKINLFSHDLFKYLKYRKSVYGDFYPFDAVGSKIEVNANLTDKQLFYVYLLMSSHLGGFVSDISTLTSDFEQISLDCLKSYFGEKIQLHVFGKNALKVGSVFSGNKATKYKMLAEFFNEKYSLKDDEFAPTDNADEGIDIVGWINFADSSPGKVLIAGQCKCQKDWYEYKFSSSFDKLNGIMSMRHQNLNFALIPICFRRDNGDWHQDGKTAGVIVVDRQRLVSMSGKLESFLSSKSYSVVKSFVKSSESIV